MLDVHAPHHPTHTWRDFFLHIATITVGLLIAVGLEQTVEAIHRHEQVRHAREELAAEREKNIKLFALETRTLEYETPIFLTNEAVLRYLRAHPGTPPSQWPGAVVWYAGEIPFVNATWTALQKGDVVEHLTRGELEEATELYERLTLVRTAELSERSAAEAAGQIFASTGGLEHASSAELDQLTSALDDLLLAHARIGGEMNRLNRRFPSFAPAPARKPLADILGMAPLNAEEKEMNKEFLEISGHSVAPDNK